MNDKNAYTDLFMELEQLVTEVAGTKNQTLINTLNLVLASVKKMDAELTYRKCLIDGMTHELNKVARLLHDVKNDLYTIEERIRLLANYSSSDQLKLIRELIIRARIDTETSHRDLYASESKDYPFSTSFNILLTRFELLYGEKYQVIRVIDSIPGKIDTIPYIKDYLYRIAKEALNNIVEHSTEGTSLILAELYVEGEQVCLSISDDGYGFDVDTMLKADDRFGLRAMKARAADIGGLCSITSSDKGTRVKVEIPF